VEDRRFQEKNAQVLGISVDSAPVQRAFCSSLGNIPYPILADFHPKGQVADLYGIYNKDRGNSQRAVIIVDKEGVVQFKQIYERSLPDPADILAEVEKLG